jgi:hypothetical protein
LVKGGEQEGLCCSKALVELDKELGAMLRGDDSASSPISRIRSAFDEVRRFKIVEEIGHDRAIDAEVLGQGELAPNGALGRCRKDLVAPWTAREICDRIVRSHDVGPKQSAQTPAQVLCQCVVTAGGFPDYVSMTRGVVHNSII